jgi:hypothetical protein
MIAMMYFMLLVLDHMLEPAFAVKSGAEPLFLGLSAKTQSCDRMDNLGDDEA